MTGAFNVVSLLGEVEGASISLKALELQHPLLARSALIHVVYSHYMRSLLPELIKLIGSTNALGKFLLSLFFTYVRLSPELFCLCPCNCSVCERLEM